jgi:aspartate kinase
MMINLSTKDYSFIAEDNIEKIFDEVVRYGIKVNIMQNSAISFGICVDDMPPKVDKFIKSLENDFIITKEQNLTLLSIKNYKDTIADVFLKDKIIITELRQGNTYQFIIKNQK